MIVDFVNIKKQMDRRLELYLREQVRQRASFVSLCKKTVYFEGERSVGKAMDGVTRDAKVIGIEGKFSFTREQIKTLKLKDIIQKIEEVAESMAKQQTQFFFSEVNKITEEVGNVVRGKIILLQRLFWKC